MLPEIPTGIHIYVWEHSALWELTVKGTKLPAGGIEGGTLGYKDQTNGMIPKSSEIEVRYVELEDYRRADGFAASLTKEGYKRVLVIKGMPNEKEVGHE